MVLGYLQLFLFKFNNGFCLRIFFRKELFILVTHPQMINLKHCTFDDHLFVYVFSVCWKLVYCCKKIRMYLVTETFINVTPLGGMRVDCTKLLCIYKFSDCRIIGVTGKRT